MLMLGAWLDWMGSLRSTWASKSAMAGLEENQEVMAAVFGGLVVVVPRVGCWLWSSGWPWLPVTLGVVYAQPCEQMKA